MVLTIGIGNAHVEIACVEGDFVLFSESTETDVRKTDLEYAFDIMHAFRKHGVSIKEPKGAVISSSVPQVSIIVADAVKRVFSFSPCIASAKKQRLLKIDLESPASLGTSLLSDAVAVKYLYGCPAILIDMGTATSIGVLKPDGSYAGGAILPGLQSSVNALIGGTAALPKLEITEARSVLGRETVSCINAGVLYGNAGMVDGLLTRMIAEMQLKENEGSAVRIVMTGKLSALLAPYLKHSVTVDPYLRAKGLYLLYKDRKEANA